jgi:hypothetical protein
MRRLELYKKGRPLLEPIQRVQLLEIMELRGLRGCALEVFLIHNLKQTYNKINRSGTHRHWMLELTPFTFRILFFFFFLKL